MAEKKKEVEVKVEDFSDFVKGLSGLVKENYLSGLELSLSLWEENQKFVNAQLEQLFTAQKEYAAQLKSNLEKLPKEFPHFYFDGNFDRLTNAQKEYIKLVRNVSDKLAKDFINLTQKATEKAFSAFEDHLNLFKS